MQSANEEIRQLGGDLVAVSADPPGRSRRLARQLGIEFPLLSDTRLTAIDTWGLRHPGGGLSGDIARPATFILDESGVIRWRDLTENWRIRTRPDTIVDVLQSLDRLAR